MQSQEPFLHLEPMGYFLSIEVMKLIMGATLYTKCKLGYAYYWQPFPPAAPSSASPVAGWMVTPPAAAHAALAAGPAGMTSSNPGLNTFIS